MADAHDRSLIALNDALCDFARRWSVDGDYLRCTECNRPVLASCILPFHHAADCPLVGSEPHPWRTLADMLRPLATASERRGTGEGGGRG